MLKSVLTDWKVLLGITGASVAVLALARYVFFQTPENQDALERRRRLRLNQIGRIAEGQVVEFAEHAPQPIPAPKKFSKPQPQTQLDGRARTLVSYSYAISGVTYHTAQDVTGLESQIRFERLVTGHPASVKYDPANPSDSILVADDWSGLR